MDQLLNDLIQRYPQLAFTPSSTFIWSPETREIFYNPDKDDEKHTWSLLHETGHALLEHTSYQADFELLALEIAAWEKAKTLAADFGIRIDDDHIQDCLDTYRDWLYARSICPTCTTKCLQQPDFIHYRCHNCHTIWKVSTSRLSRPYRSKKGVRSAHSFYQELDSL